MPGPTGRTFSHRTRNRRAFSLIEATLVLGIIAIFGAMALPRYNNSLTQYRLNVAAQRLVADLQFARSQAIARSRTQSIAFALANDSYTMANVEGLKDRNATYAVDLSAEPYRVDLTTATFGGSTTLTFDLFGKPDSGGTIVIALRGVTRTITVDSVTGRASL